MGALDGKVAFITGAGRGIGRAIAGTFAKEGAIIAAAARTENEINRVCDEINSAGGKALPVQMDLRSEESIKQAVAKAHT